MGTVPQDGMFGTCEEMNKNVADTATYIEGSSAIINPVIIKTCEAPKEERQDETENCIIHRPRKTKNRGFLKAKISISIISGTSSGR